MPPKDGLDLLRAQLSVALGALPMSPHSIEDALGIGHGTLPRLLDRLYPYLARSPVAR